MEPHVVPIGRSQLIRKVLVRKLMEKQTVKTFRRLCVVETVAVDRLMLHSHVGSLNHSDFLVTERIGTDLLLQVVECWREFAEEPPSLLFFSGQVPVVHRDPVTEPTLVSPGNLLVGPNVERNSVGIRVMGQPVPTGTAVR